MADKKNPLALLLALAGPKSRNSEGMTDASMTAPDQSGDALSPGSTDDETAEMTEEMSEPSPNSLMLPKGFKAASDKDGVVTTTIRGRVNGDRFDVIALGDMPMDGSGAVEEAGPAKEEVEEETVTEEPDPEEAKMAMASKRKRDDSMKAKAAFQTA